MIVPEDGKYIMFLIICGTEKEFPLPVLCISFPLLQTRSSLESNESIWNEFSWG